MRLSKPSFKGWPENDVKQYNTYIHYANVTLANQIKALQLRQKNYLTRAGELVDRNKD